MFKTAILSLALIAGLQAQARQPNFRAAIHAVNTAIEKTQAQMMMTGLEWKVGESADYAVDASIVQGTVHTFVREDKAEGLWVQSDADLGFAGKQKIETLLDKGSGKVLKMLVNGKEQTPPENGDVVKVEDATVKVPKFPNGVACHYVEMKSKKNEITKVWMKPEEIPVGGIIKTETKAQSLNVVVQLTDFKKM